jgi:hypothetical protein
MFLNTKMSAAINAYSEYKKQDGTSKPPSGNLKFPLKDEPYEPRVKPGVEAETFSCVVIITERYGVPEPEFKLRADGSIKFTDILNGNDFSGITIKPEDNSLKDNFWIATDKGGDLAIFFNYYPEDIELWRAEPVTGPTGIYKKIILSKQGYDDAIINVHLRYDDSMLVEGRGAQHERNSF